IPPKPSNIGALLRQNLSASAIELQRSDTNGVRTNTRVMTPSASHHFVFMALPPQQYSTCGSASITLPLSSVLGSAGLRLREIGFEEFRQRQFHGLAAAGAAGHRL